MDFAPKLTQLDGGDTARKAMALRTMVRSMQDSFTALEKVGGCGRWHVELCTGTVLVCEASVGGDSCFSV